MGWSGTIMMLAAGSALAGLCLWDQRRTRPLGQVGLLPSNLLLGVALILVVLAMAHMVTLVTGRPPGRSYDP